LNDYVDKKQKNLYEFIDWMNKSPISRKLKREQLEILKEAVRDPGREFTAKQMSDNFGITSNTARKYLNELVDLDLLVQSMKKIGKAVVYLAPANLKSKLNKS
jgi:Fic family protein